MTEASPYMITSDPGGPPPVDRGTRLAVWMQSRPARWAAPLLVLGCIGAALGYTQWTNPVDSSADSIPTCLVKLTTGLDCPGCGGTRAAWFLMHGDLPAAARHHIVFVFAVPFLIYMYVAWATKTALGWRLPQLRITPRVLGIFLGVWGVFMVLRNLPWAPFTYFFV